ncbi:MAG: hypothetical protein A3E01_10920 [Gammaproteobacteria bacterium RIFCSPHIGHO2_12_FULL_63_22]|nr:MAG: hypothetical protein A3E01_10920 [Gammaproteobacteria bacterium RIFCSPHIGHO2_12_FULL_63_22]
MSQAINTHRSASARLLPIVLLLAAIGLVAYFYWPKPSTSNNATDLQTTTPASTESGATSATGRSAGSPAGGYAVDANGERLLNEAGLPYSAEPLPVAKPIPIRAAPSEVIGYTVDAQGVAKPIRAGELKAVPNTPGSFAVVDMWAEGGPTVVPATKGHALSPAELERLRAAEQASERVDRQ